MLAEWCRYRLDFRFEARTSRESMRSKDTWLVRLNDQATGECAWGECALFRGLSTDDTPDFEARLDEACRTFSAEKVPELSSALRFGFESAMERLRHRDTDTPFGRGEAGIPINGLIWMGDKATMRSRIDEKLAAGFGVLKLKIGGIDFDQEVDLLRYIRSQYSPLTLELRLDANGSFTPDSAPRRLDTLSQFAIHSIEQPIRAGQPEAMARLCADTPIAIALDEELIGCRDAVAAGEMLDNIRPQYIILKPALCGGLSGADIWADAACNRDIGWWATSALESNIGLHAIASWVARRGVTIPQGLGTGQLYHNNITSPLRLRADRLWLDPTAEWDYTPLV